MGGSLQIEDEDNEKSHERKVVPLEMRKRSYYENKKYKRSTLNEMH
jgi:hypothetical protein